MLDKVNFMMSVVLDIHQHIGGEIITRYPTTKKIKYQDYEIGHQETNYGEELTVSIKLTSLNINFSYLFGEMFKQLQHSNYSKRILRQDFFVLEIISQSGWPTTISLLDPDFTQTDTFKNDEYFLTYKNQLLNNTEINRRYTYYKIKKLKNEFTNPI